MFALFVASLFSLVLSQNVIEASNCGGVNRITCKDVFTAEKCGVLNECAKIWRSSLWEKYRNDTSSKCTVCRILARNRPLSQLEGLCTELQLPHPDQCKRAVAQLPSILGFTSDHRIAKQRDVDILCNTLTACETDVYIGGLDFNSIICDDCKQLLKTVQSFVADNATADAIISYLDSAICDNLSEHVRDYCKQTVKVHVPVILQLIEVHLSPDDICALLRLCPQSPYAAISLSQFLDSRFSTPSQSVSSSNVSPCSAQTAYSWINRPSGRNAFMFTSYGPVPFVQHGSPATPDCATCIAVIDQMKERIKDPAMQAEIKEDMKREICSTLGFMREVCIRAIDSQFDNMVREIENLDSQKACAVFRMCGPKALPIRSQALPQPSAQVPGLCPLCELVVEKLIEMVVDNSTEASIAAALDQICLFVPQSYKKRCDNFIDNFGAQIVEAIIKGTAPKMACSAMGLCTGPFMQTLQIPATPVVAPRGVKYCSVCKTIVHVIYNELMQNRTEEEIKKMAKHVCSILPETYASECSNLIDQYVPLVIQFFEANFQPEEVCERIGFCPDETGSQQALCLRGPSYWCLNRETAARCNASAICSTRLFSPSSANEICHIRNRPQICASHELAAACGLTNECAGQRVQSFMQTVAHLLNLRPQFWSSGTGKWNCTICTDVLNDWSTSRKYLGTPNFSVHICSRYPNPADREQCDRVWRQRYRAFHHMLNANTKPETICTQLNLCQVPTTGPASPCLEDPFYAISSQRAAEQCGTLDLWNQLQQMESSLARPQADSTVPPPVVSSQTDTDDSVVQPEIVLIPDTPVCRNGPDAFCQTMETAQSCGPAGVRYCQKYVWAGDQPRGTPKIAPRRIGSSRCSWGPSYWCSSFEAAASCGSGAVNFCRQRRLI